MKLRTSWHQEETDCETCLGARVPISTTLTWRVTEALNLRSSLLPLGSCRRSLVVSGPGAGSAASPSRFLLSEASLS